MRLTKFRPIVAAAAGLLILTAGARAEARLSGCYERSYVAAHLSAHPGQRVVRLTLAVEPMTEMPSIVAGAALKMWIRREKKHFQSDGACMAMGDELVCNGSLSGAEAESCKTKADGLHNCRINDGNPGKFRIAARPEGVLVTIQERLELVQPPFDAGPFLYLNPDNTENHAFLLKLAPASACK